MIFAKKMVAFGPLQQQLEKCRLQYFGSLQMGDKIQE